MSFGKRQALPPFGAPSRAFATTAPRVASVGKGRNGGGRIGYLWAFLAVAVASFVSPAIMATIPALNPTGAGHAVIALVVLGNVLPSMLSVCAVTLPLIDLVLKAVNRRVTWLYAALNTIAVVLISCAIMATKSAGWIIALALLPALAGGYVLGRFRTR
jgi:hypothetical protein